MSSRRCLLPEPGRFAVLVLSGLMVLMLASVTTAVAQQTAHAQSVELSPTQLAAKTGEPVAVPENTTSTSRVVANPDGTFTLTQHVEPVRVRTASGWNPVDLTLVRQPDGTIGPASSIVGLRLSSGGVDAPLVVAAKDGYEVGLRWQGHLPEPLLKGRTATYRNVLPGVDLKVTATAKGFSQLLVVKTRQAAQNPKLDKITFGSHTSGVSINEVADGKRLVARDPVGQVVFAGTASKMWDSSRDSSRLHGLAASAQPEAAAPAPGALRAEMAVTVSESSVAVIPDEGFLADPETTYPVYIDPSYFWAGGTNHHVVVQSGYPNAHNYDVTSGDLNDLKAGYVPWLGISRSYAEMNLSAVGGKYIHSATFRTRVKHSWSCNGGPTELWLTAPIGPGTTWNSQPGWGRYLAQTSVSNNASYCPSQGGADMVITDAVRQGAAAYWPHITLMLKAQNESDKYAWRRFDLNPVLEIRYNSYPNLPSGLSMQGGLIGCATGADRPVIGTTTPTLRAKASDPDGGVLYDTGFRLHSGTSGSMQFINEYVAYHTPSGSFAEVSIPPGVLANDGIYHWGVWTGDGQLRSPIAGDCEFEVDTTDPGMPAVESPDYPYDTPAGGIGQTGTFTIKPNGTDDVDYYLYSFTEDQSDDPQQRIDANGLGGEATIQWTPTLEGPQTLFVRSVDRAGNRSQIYRYKVFVKAHEPLASGLVARWKLNANLADATGNGHALHAAGNAAADAVGYEDGAAGLDGTGDYLATTGPVLDISKSFSVSAWVKINDLGGWSTAVSQDGNRISGFKLQLTAEGEWTFVMFGDDSDGGPGQVRVMAGQASKVGVWNHLLGVYDAGSDELRLYVNGELRQEVPYVSTWNAEGSFVLGAAKWNGVRADHLPGIIDDLRVYQRVITSSEAALLANKPVLRAHYKMNEGSGTTTVDDVTGQEATFHGGPTWNVGQYTSLHFDAAWEDYEYLTAPRPAIRTDRSYTVSAWVRTDGFNIAAQAVSISGEKFSPFLLGYRPENNGWGLMGSCSSTYDCGWLVLAPQEAAANTWVHLVGVYDAVTHEARLYVNGQFVGKNSGVTSWNGNGELLIGVGVWSGRQTDYWDGSIDDVRVYSGVLSDAAIGQLAIHL